MFGMQYMLGDKAIVKINAKKINYDEQQKMLLLSYTLDFDVFGPTWEGSGTQKRDNTFRVNFSVENMRYYVFPNTGESSAPTGAFMPYCIGDHEYPSENDEWWENLANDENGWSIKCDYDVTLYDDDDLEFDYSSDFELNKANIAGWAESEKQEDEMSYELLDNFFFTTGEESLLVIDSTYIQEEEDM